MDEKDIYQVYADMMKIHRRYVGCRADKEHLMELVKDINAINSRVSNNFCNAMMDSLRRWFIVGFTGVGKDEIRDFYIAVWGLHKRYLHKMRKACDDAFWAGLTRDINRLADKYGGVRAVQEIGMNIAEELEMRGDEAG